MECYFQKSLITVRIILQVILSSLLFSHNLNHRWVSLYARFSVKKKRSNIKLIIHKFLLNCRFENYIGDQVIFYNWYVFYSTSRRTSRVAATKTSTTEVNPTMPNYCLLSCFYVTFYSKCWKMWKEFVKIAKVQIFTQKLAQGPRAFL